MYGELVDWFAMPADAHSVADTLSGVGMKITVRVSSALSSKELGDRRLTDDALAVVPQAPTVTEKKRCDCEMMALMRYGCKCGGS